MENTARIAGEKATGGFVFGSAELTGEAETIKLEDGTIM